LRVQWEVFLNRWKMRLEKVFGESGTVRADFAIVLEKGLDGVMRYTETLPDGNKIYKYFDITEFSSDAQMEYARIMSEIKTISTALQFLPLT